ncbi:MAG: hypothetical protein QM731_15330 [Chitinophagaceae bacterium]
MLLTAAGNWATWLGHFHPLIVHLPIGILIIAFILEIIAWKRAAATSLNEAILICLAVGCISAILSCLLGWWLSSEGGYPQTTLQLHQWMGIGVALLAGVCWFVKKQQGSLIKAGKTYKALMVLLMLMLTLTGHFGGNMTHGEDYLTAGIPQPFAGWFGITGKKDTVAARKPVADVNEAVLYADLVVPVLQEKCFSCHSAKKVKGSLRMDTEELLFKGGKHGSIIKAGNAAESELIKRLLLPATDDKRMPPKDQPQLSKEEVALLQWWVQSGADTKKKVKELAPDAGTKTMLASFATVGAAQSQVAEGNAAPVSAVFSKNPPAPAKADLDALTSLGVLVSPVAKDKNLLDVSCINYTAFDNSKVVLLTKLADNIVWLKLDNTAITDEALTQIAQLKDLVHISLAGTNITAAGIAKLQQLSNLEYINIVNTRVGDDALTALSKIPSLKHIYCWNSLITDNAIKTFRQNKPTIQVESGSKN